MQPTDRPTRLLELARGEASASWGVMDPCPKIFFHRENLTNVLLGNHDAVRFVNCEAWPSLTCNARCTCTYVENRAREEADRPGARAMLMDPKLFDRMVGMLEHYDCASLTVTGGGDPTVNPELPSFLRRLGKSKLDFGFYSNGFIVERFASALAQNSPTFVRISVNAGTPEFHNGVYRAGKDKLTAVVRGIEAVGRSIQEAGVTTTLGIGYIFVPPEFPEECPYRATDENLRGVRSMIEGLSSKIPLSYAAFRPYFFYYGAEGSTMRAKQDASSCYRALADRIRDALGTSINGTKIDIWDESFAAIQREVLPDASLALPWVTSFTEKGIGYAASELNGSPLPDDGSHGIPNPDALKNYAWGDLRVQDLEEAWASPRRLAIHRAFRTGALKMPSMHKLYSVERLLRKITALGTWTMQEVDAFWAQFDAEGLNARRPAHWKFI